MEVNWESFGQKRDSQKKKTQSRTIYSIMMMMMIINMAELIGVISCVCLYLFLLHHLCKDWSCVVALLFRDNIVHIYLKEGRRLMGEGRLIGGGLMI